MKKAIGIIGGMGPEASEKFYGLLIHHAQKDFNAAKNEEFPEIYLASVPVPDFISTERNEEKALAILINRVQEMDKLPIGFFCMACNTGHLLLEDLQKHTKKPFISLLEEVPRFIKRKKLKKVGILATPTTIRTKLYRKAFERYGVELIEPKNGDIELLGTIVLETIAGKNFEKNSVLVQKIAKLLLDRGAEAIVEACTEIPLIFPKQHLVPVFDTLEILASAVLKRYYRSCEASSNSLKEFRGV